jgi:hypothetical protein
LRKLVGRHLVGKRSVDGSILIFVWLHTERPCAMLCAKNPATV